MQICRCRPWTAPPILHTLPILAHLLSHTLSHTLFAINQSINQHVHVGHGRQHEHGGCAGRASAPHRLHADRRARLPRQEPSTVAPRPGERFAWASHRCPPPPQLSEYTAEYDIFGGGSHPRSCQKNIPLTLFTFPLLCRALRGLSRRCRLVASKCTSSQEGRSSSTAMLCWCDVFACMPCSARMLYPHVVLHGGTRTIISEPGLA